MTCQGTVVHVRTSWVECDWKVLFCYMSQHKISIGLWALNYFKVDSSFCRSEATLAKHRLWKFSSKWGWSFECVSYWRQTEGEVGHRV